MNNLQPREIVAFLDDYIIGQDNAKKTIAIALRNRFRRLKLDPKIRDEITPKNILMIGSSGVGKTELARRMAKMMDLPFIKVEASKYTEVGFVGRDVESMVRDLVSTSMHLVEKLQKDAMQEEIENYVLDKITKILLPPLSDLASEDKKQQYQDTFAKMRQRVKNGELDENKIEITLPKNVQEANKNLPPEMIKMQESILKALSSKENIKKEVPIKLAKVMLKKEAFENLSDVDDLKQRALDLAQTSGIIFIDEIDKVATSNKSRQDPSKEGVQRDLLPIVEGSVVNTKYGQVKTDNILFIAAGAFHVSKPSDLIPELQGRFPIRVELNNLDANSLYKILKNTKNSLINQYKTLLSVEQIDLHFEDEALLEIANLAALSNEKTEDIGARRLHTVIEKILEDISFESDAYKGQKIVITKEQVTQKLAFLVANTDLSRYIL
ncbi:MAG: HslU--HslV peptidase ATPase subunit [Helicobacter sp.]|nr:HslU--HslV peptidase ATPase subunit [Helicobacter sp.]